MGRRVQVDEALPRAVLPGRVLNELYAHARETQPEECCGLILGDAEQRFQRVLRCRNDMSRRHHANPQEYPRDGRSAFYLDPGDQEAAEKAAEASGQFISALYHSHVDAHEGGGVYLSALDLEYATQAGFPFPDAAQLVIAVCDARVTGVGVFERETADAPFRGRGVEPA